MVLKIQCKSKIFLINNKKIHIYLKNTGLYYRGTYELDFLNFCFKNNIIVENGKRIRYIIDNKTHFYFPDFLYRNLIIEIKSKYTFYKNLEINLLKQKSSLDNGFDFIFVVDKDYNNFITKV